MLFAKLLLYFEHTDMHYNITSSFMDLDISDNTIKGPSTIELLGRLFSEFNNISRLSLAQSTGLTASMLLILLEALQSNYSLLEIDFTSNPIANDQMLPLLQHVLNHPTLDHLTVTLRKSTTE